MSLPLNIKKFWKGIGENMQNKKIKAVIFDVDGVLALGVELRKDSKLGKSFHEEVAKIFDLDLDTWLDYFDPIYTKSIEGRINKMSVLKNLAKNIGVYFGEIEKVILKVYSKYYSRNDLLYDFAFKLKKKGYKIAILSDQWHLSKDIFLKKKDSKRFNVVVVSCDVGLRKPNPKIYNYTLNKLGVKPSEAVFIDNRKWNIDAARKLGIKSILFRNNEQIIARLEKIGVKI